MPDGTFLLSGRVALMSLYSASKGVMHAFTAALAKEVATTRVTVNCVGPGTVDTARQLARDPELRAQRQAAIPMGRFAQPEEVAGAVGSSPAMRPPT